MFIIYNGEQYYEGEKIKYDNGYGIITSVIKYGDWHQDGSGGEYGSIHCYGWYLEMEDIELYSGETDTIEEVLEYMPNFERKYSLIEVLDEKYCYKVIGHVR